MSVPVSIRISLWVWLIAALIVGRQHWLVPLLGPALQGVIFTLTALVLLLCFKLRSVRTWLNQLDLRSLVIFHVTRFVGIYFLLLYQRGELPYAFAVPGGWGDILVATGALLVCFLPMGSANRLRAIQLWNIFGLIDIVLVLVTAARLGLKSPGQLRALTYLPLSLLPTFIVPLVLTTHVLILVRQRQPTRLS